MSICKLQNAKAQPKSVNNRVSVGKNVKSWENETLSQFMGLTSGWPIGWLSGSSRSNKNIKQPREQNITKQASPGGQLKKGRPQVAQLTIS